ncbi:MAG: hypothetical protein HUU08_00720 [Candidatus Brocadia sp.]|nr:hypothetical protein [Candidatus Brocadia sp.]
MTVYPPSLAEGENRGAAALRHVGSGEVVVVVTYTDEEIFDKLGTAHAGYVRGDGLL